MQKNNLAFLSCLLLAIAIILGAWNAHGMENLVTEGRIDAKYLKTFYTGVQYQFVNALGLLFLSSYFHAGSKMLRVGAILILCGMCIFSFCLYILSFHQIIGSGFKILGAITPIGGLLMAAGWILAAFAFLKKAP